MGNSLFGFYETNPLPGRSFPFAQAKGKIHKACLVEKPHETDMGPVFRHLEHHKAMGTRKPACTLNPAGIVLNGIPFTLQQVLLPLQNCYYCYICRLIKGKA